MSHTEVTDVYNKLNGLFDREYAPQLAKLQPGVEQQQLEADRDNRKANFERSFTRVQRRLAHGLRRHRRPPRVHVQQRRGRPEALQGRQEPLLLLHQGPPLEDLRRDPAQGGRAARRQLPGGRHEAERALLGARRASARPTRRRASSAPRPTGRTPGATCARSTAAASTSSGIVLEDKNTLTQPAVAALEQGRRSLRARPVDRRAHAGRA